MVLYFGLWPNIGSFGRLEQNDFHHLYESEEKASPIFRATKLALQRNISHSKKKYLGMFQRVLFLIQQ